MLLDGLHFVNKTVQLTVANSGAVISSAERQARCWEPVRSNHLLEQLFPVTKTNLEIHHHQPTSAVILAQYPQVEMSIRQKSIWVLSTTSQRTSVRRS